MSVESGRKIRYFRVEADMTQADVAEALTDLGHPVRANTISTWERGKHEPQRGVYKALALIFTIELGREITIADIRGDVPPEG